MNELQKRESERSLDKAVKEAKSRLQSVDQIRAKMDKGTWKYSVISKQEHREQNNH